MFTKKLQLHPDHSEWMDFYGYGGFCWVREGNKYIYSLIFLKYILSNKSYGIKIIININLITYVFKTSTTVLNPKL